MGWTEGDGLGKNNAGIKECIQVERRPELQGLGYVPGVPQANVRDWEIIYNEALSSIKIKMERRHRKLQGNFPRSTCKNDTQLLSKISNNKKGHYSAKDEQLLKLFSKKLKNNLK